MKKISIFWAKAVAQLSVGATLLLVSNFALAGGAAAPVPEPGPLGLLIVSGVALVIARRFRRDK